jgi:hypothetical protein
MAQLLVASRPLNLTVPLHLQRLLFAKAIGDDLQSVAPPAAAPAPKFQCRIVPPPNCDVRKRGLKTRLSSQFPQITSSVERCRVRSPTVFILSYYSLFCSYSQGETRAEWVGQGIQHP